MKLLSFILINLMWTNCLFSSEKEVIDIQNHPQKQFPSIKLSIGERNVEYYTSSLAASQTLKFVKEAVLPAQEVHLNSYIFAKEFVDSVRIPHTVANQKTKAQFIALFNEQEPGKIVHFLLEVNDRKRTAKDGKELEEIARLIEKKQTEDIPGGTAFFSTGYIEIKAPDQSNTRYYIKASDINRETVKLSPDQTKISLLKAMTIYGFQQVLSGLSLDNMEKEGAEDRLFSKLGEMNSVLCGAHCPGNSMKDLSPFAASIGQIVNFEVVGADKIDNMDDFNKYVLAQQFCLLKGFSELCGNAKLKAEVNSLLSNPILVELQKKHGHLEHLCQFVSDK